MNVLLIESHYRSRSWFQALEGLAEVFIISVIPEERELFIANGVEEKRILNLHHPDLSGYDYDTVRQDLRKLESEMALNISEILLMDRTLRLKDYAYVVKYVYHTVIEVLSFIKSNQIQVVIIEPTWTHEILISRICAYLGIPVMAPVKDKLLADQFFIFHGYLHAKTFKRNRIGMQQCLSKKLIEKLNGNEKPQYFNKFNNRNKITLAKFRVLYDITRLSLLGYRNDNIQPSVWFALRKKTIAIFRVMVFSYFNRFTPIRHIDTPFILVTLHVQPEASVDVVGEKFSNQLEFIRQISRSTPIDYRVVVKEHPHDFGQRSAAFYNALGAMPNVQILGPHEESREAIKRASLVVSITGTSSLEAALCGIPAVTAVEMFFSELMVQPAFDPYIDRTDELLRKADAWRAAYRVEEIDASLDKIQADSFEGNSGDFKTDPNVLSSRNVARLRNAFREVLDTVRGECHANR